jgi:hypothetical protein
VVQIAFGLKTLLYKVVFRKMLKDLTVMTDSYKFDLAIWFGLV